MKFPLGTIGLVGDGQPPRHKVRVSPGGRNSWHAAILQDGFLIDAFWMYDLNEMLEAVGREYPDIIFDPEEAK